MLMWLGDGPGLGCRLLSALLFEILCLVLDVVRWVLGPPQAVALVLGSSLGIGPDFGLG